MKSGKKNKQNKQTNVRYSIGMVMSVIQIVFACVAFIAFWRSGLLPGAYLIVLAIGMLVLFLVGRVLMRKRSKKLSWGIGMALTIITAIVFALVSVYLSQLINTLQEITVDNEGVEVEITSVGVYVLNSDPAETINDVAGDNFGILTTLVRDETDAAIEKIEENTQQTISYIEYSGITALADGILQGDCRSIILSESFIDLISDLEGYEDFEDKIRLLEGYQIETVVESTSNGDDIEKDVFVMYISGVDTRGEFTSKGRSDSNIIAVVNTNTHQILLVSTPRDYYVNLSISGDEKDKLTHAGIYGVQVSMDTLAMLYDVDIDYYFRINFTGFKDLVDALGGVDVESEVEFSVDSYYYTIGTNHLYGEEALAFARERKSFASGDRQRGKNQMAVIKGVVNSMQSTAVLNNFFGIMEGIESSLDTSIPYSVLQSLVQLQLSENPSWDVVSYSVDGSGTSASTYSLSTPVYVMIPDETTVDYAKELINAVLNDEIVSVE